MKDIRSLFGKQLASDVVRDGVGLELLSEDQVLAEVFRSDADHSLLITTFGNDVPLVAIEELIAEARHRLGEFEDGTPTTRFCAALPSFNAKLRNCYL